MIPEGVFTATLLKGFIPRGLAKGVGRRGFPRFVLICSEKRSEEIGANRNKSRYSRKQGPQIGRKRGNRNKSEQIGSPQIAARVFLE